MAAWSESVRSSPQPPIKSTKRKDTVMKQDHPHHRRFQRLRPADRQGARQGGPHRLCLDARHHGPQRGRRSPMSSTIAATTASICAPSSSTSARRPRSTRRSPRSSPSRAGSTSLIHNAGHMVFGPAEAFTPEQFAQLYDVNVLGTQRVNRAALPQLRKQGRGLLVWVSQQQLGRRHAALSRALFRRQGRHGRAGGDLCARARALGHRDLDHRAGRLHQGHQSLRPFGLAGR